MDDAHMASDDAGNAAAHAFIAKWQGVTASELSTSQSFLTAEAPCNAGRRWLRPGAGQIIYRTKVLGCLGLSLQTKKIICVGILVRFVGCSDAPQQMPNSLEPRGVTSAPVTPLQRENDRICMKAYGVVCHAIPHLPGPVNAEVFGEDRACVVEGVAKLVDGEWVQDNKYLNPETGERYGDICIAVSL